MTSNFLHNSRRRSKLGLVFIAVVALASCSTTSAGPNRADAVFFGVLAASCRPDRAEAERRAGVRLAVVALRWQDYEPAAGTFDADYVENFRQRVAGCASAGLRVILSVGLQYPPNWVRQLPAGTYRNQAGTPSSNTVNLVFSRAVRDAATTYLHRIDRDLGLGNFAAVRVGTSDAGELGYPSPTTATPQNPQSYWAFDTAAQTGSGLSRGLSPSPLPGWVPGTATWRNQPVTPGQVTGWFRWYDRALASAVTWQIDLLRHLRYTGDIHIPLAGRGVLPPDLQVALRARLDGTGDRDGSLQRGMDYPDQLPIIAAAATTPRAEGVVSVDVTGVDDVTAVRARHIQPPQDTCHPADEHTDFTATPDLTSWSSTRWTTAVARRSGLSVLGENPGPPTAPTTGGSPDSDSLVKQLLHAPRYAADCHLTALLWAFEDDLFPDVTIDDYAKTIRQQTK